MQTGVSILGEVFGLGPLAVEGGQVVGGLVGGEGEACRTRCRQRLRLPDPVTRLGPAGPLAKWAASVAAQ